MVTNSLNMLSWESIRHSHWNYGKQGTQIGADMVATVKTFVISNKSISDVASLKTREHGQRE